TAKEASATDMVWRAISYTSQAITTAWEPVARVPQKRPARKSTYGGLARRDDVSSAVSGVGGETDIHHFHLSARERERSAHRQYDIVVSYLREPGSRCCFDCKRRLTRSNPVNLPHIISGNLPTYPGVSNCRGRRRQRGVPSRF